MLFSKSRVSAPPELDEAPEYWITYSDLMVALLMTFALLLFLALGKLQQGAKDAQATINRNRQAIQTASGLLTKLGPKVQIDTATGVLTIDSELLFGYNEATLSPEGEAQVEQIATVFLPALLIDPATDSLIEEIAIEGHTDTVGTYLSNLRLSQARAGTVMQHIVESTYGTPKAERLRQVIVASGKSKVRPVRVDGEISDAKSRRIEIHIRFRDDAILQQVLRASQVR